MTQVKLEPYQLPSHNELKGITPNDHHEAFTPEDHFNLDHSGLSGIPQIDDVNISVTNTFSSKKIKEILSINKINDDLIDTQLAWSSYKINNYLNSLINDSIQSSESTWSSQKIENEVSSLIDDSKVDGDIHTTWSSSKIIDYVNQNVNTNFDINSIIDDTQISISYTWSSLKINDTIKNLLNKNENENNKPFTSKIISTIFTKIKSGTSLLVPPGNNGIYYSFGSSTIEKITINTPSNSMFFGFLNYYYHVGNATSNGFNKRAINSGSYDFTDIDIVKNIIEYINIDTPGNSQIFGYLMNKLVGACSTSNSSNDRGIFVGGTSSCCINEWQCVISYVTISQLSNASFFGYLAVNKRQYASATSNGTRDRAVILSGVIVTNSYYVAIYNTIEYVTISNLSNSRFFGNLYQNSSNYVLHNGRATRVTSNSVNDRGFVVSNKYNSTKANPFSLSQVSQILNIAATGDSLHFSYLSSISGILFETNSNGTGNIALYDSGSNLTHVSIITSSSGLYFGQLIHNGKTATSDA